MLERIVVVFERLAGIERRVDVDQLHLAAVHLGVLGCAHERAEGVERIAANQEVVARRARGIPDQAHLPQQSHLVRARVVALHPLVAGRAVREQRLVFVGPRQR